MRAFKDITGQKFGRLTVIKYAGKNKHGQALYECICACGKTLKGVMGGNLSSGNTQSCGCLNKERVREARFIDITGQKFGMLTVTKYVGKDKRGQSIYDCLCDCGKTLKGVMGDHLSSGHTQSCGCCKLISENNCRTAIEEVFGVSFPKSNPTQNPTGMYLDGYNSNLMVAFERQGEQHYQHMPHFHRKGNTLEKQQTRDAKKRKRCQECGILLLEVPYFFTEDDIYIGFAHVKMALDSGYVGSSQIKKAPCLVVLS
jgi:hypothetical protein